MKNAINYLIVFMIGTFLFSINVKALSPHAEEILDIISKDRKLTITDISVLPPKYVEGEDIYDLFYSHVITSYINELPKIKEYYSKNSDHEFNIIVFCKSATNCGIKVNDSKYDLFVEEKEDYDEWNELDNAEYPGYGFEHFDVSIKIESEENVNTSVFNQMNKYKSEDVGVNWYNYYLYDLGFINFIFNNNNYNLFELYKMDINKILKYFPETKNLYESIEQYKILPGGVTGAGSVTNSLGADLTHEMVSYYKNTAYTSGVADFHISPILLISDQTNDSNIIEAATKKINDYIDSDKIAINIIRISGASEENINDINEALNSSLKTNTSYTSDKYKLTIGDKETDLYIVKVPEKYVDMFNTKSYSLNTGIEMATKGLDVPFDSSLEVKDVTSDYKEDESIVVAYDINLYSLLKDGYVTYSNNGFKIMIPVEDDFDEENKKVYYVDSDGKKEEYDFSIEIKDNKKYVTFVTNHLSTYAISQEVNDKIENPKTGTESITSLIIIGAFGTAFLWLFVKKYKIPKI